MATIQTNRPIRRRIQTETTGGRIAKVPAGARINSMNRQVVVADDPGNPWNGVQVSKETMQAAQNLTAGKKVTAGE